ncbi:MAG: hypothetical protein WA962_07470 [Ornithinimicrobium sp.]
MRWYAETPGRRTREVVADLLVAGWVIGWLLVGRFVHDVVAALSAPAGPMRAAGDSLHARMLDVADRVTGVPLVGEDLQRPFAATASAGTNLTGAADQLESSVDRVALWLSLLTAGTPIVLVLGVYLVIRVRAARSASMIAHYRAHPELRELLALRALSTRSPRQLCAISPDPLGAWRAGDAEVIEALAGLEMRGAGLRSRMSLA